MIAEVASAIWYGDSRTAHLLRALLAPASALFGVAAARRSRAYDCGAREVVRSSVPVISVGNLTVGGTGKTPFAALLVAMLRAMGRTPALVMRGYGGDEPILHGWLNPGVHVHADADRAVAIARAEADGADVVVLDDAFQHRRAARDLDIVLVSAEQWQDGMRLLPAGPLREPVSALRRAGLIAVTVKRASQAQVQHVRAAIEHIAPAVPLIVVEFALDTLRGVGDPDATAPMDALSGTDVLAVAGIGDPDSFFTQLEQRGAHVTRVSFADHHAYTATDAARLARRATGHKYIVTTAKDAVKLQGVWPANAPRLWYVSQAVAVSGPTSLLDAALRRALTRRSPETGAYGDRPPPVNT